MNEEHPLEEGIKLREDVNLLGLKRKVNVQNEEVYLKTVRLISNKTFQKADVKGV